MGPWDGEQRVELCFRTQHLPLSLFKRVTPTNSSLHLVLECSQCRAELNPKTQLSLLQPFIIKEKCPSTFTNWGILWEQTLYKNNSGLTIFSFLTSIKTSDLMESMRFSSSRGPKVCRIHTYFLRVTYLYAKNRLRQTVAAHDVSQIFQDAVEDLVQLLPNDGQSLLGRELSCEWLSLMRYNKNQGSRTPRPSEWGKTSQGPRQSYQYPTSTIHWGWSLGQGGTEENVISESENC